jgi:hypothetical protein
MRPIAEWVIMEKTIRTPERYELSQTIRAASIPQTVILNQKNRYPASLSSPYASAHSRQNFLAAIQWTN